MALHDNRRIRHPVELRMVTVLRTQRLTTHMQRITFGGDALRGFHSPGADDHVKLFLPNRHGQLVLPTPGPEGLVFPSGREPSPMRDYTPRHFDGARNELVIDFVLHGDGPASTWAWQAGPGQQLAVGGPRGSFLLAHDYDRYVLVGDETALPAIGRLLEELPTNTRITVLLELPDPGDRQALPTRAGIEIHWLDRAGRPGADECLLEQALRALPDAGGDTFYWIGCESRRARAMRLWLDERGVPKDSIKASGYWKAHAGDE
jgi:NADPH-dependent ferric siderophore reductase